jgi:hypothetical protein
MIFFVNLYQDLIKICQLFLGRVRPHFPKEESFCPKGEPFCPRGESFCLRYRVVLPKGRIILPKGRIILPKGSIIQSKGRMTFTLRWIMLYLERLTMLKVKITMPIGRFNPALINIELF